MDHSQQATMPETGEPVDERDQRHEQQDGMVEMARNNERHHLSSPPEFMPPSPQPFPSMIGWGLFAAVVVGGVAGWVFGRLLLSGTIVFENWDQLYSMTPGTFQTFWTGVGVAVGIATIGILTILAAPVEDPSETDH